MKKVTYLSWKKNCCINIDNPKSDNPFFITSQTVNCIYISTLRKTPKDVFY